MKAERLVHSYTLLLEKLGDDRVVCFVGSGPSLGGC